MVSSMLPAEGSLPGARDEQLVARLKRGDERAFAELISAYSPALLRVAQARVRTRAVAEEVVQETWLAVLHGLDRFEGRSSLKTWIFRILTNIAITRGTRESRCLPFSSLAEHEAGEADEPIDASRFLPADHDRWPHHWALGPTRWETPEEGLLTGETRDCILRAIDELPPAQRTVITLRDIEGWPSDEVCDALGVSEGNQRVLLHRARSKVRAAVEEHFGAMEVTVA
jgi:RNA polymerase sigma-70 factor (ECF subfamily)